MKLTEEQLWNYIDGFCSESECLEIEQILISDTESQQYYQSLLALNDSVKSELTLDTPSYAFTQSVIRRLEAEKILKSSNVNDEFRMFNDYHIMIAASLLGLVFVVFFVLQLGILPQSAAQYLPKVTNMTLSWKSIWMVLGFINLFLAYTIYDKWRTFNDINGHRI